MLNGEEHIFSIAHITTLAGYMHYMLTGVNAVGIGEASGMFPIDSAAGDYNAGMLEKFNGLLEGRSIPWKLEELLPKVLTAGEFAGTLMELGAALLDGLLPAGIPFAPAEEDAGTGMTATNAVAPRTGNVSAGTRLRRPRKVMRFGDNMREVAVTECDKVEAQSKLGWQVNTWAVGGLVKVMDEVTEAEVNAHMARYAEKCDMAADRIDQVLYQAREEAVMKKMMDQEGCMAFSNTFQDLHGMKQLPSLASQDLMAQGYGYSGEDDWKASAMTAILRAMGEGGNGASDYTYHLVKGQEYSLGTHMLEVCPSVAAGWPRIEVHPLGIGGREDPARLVFEGKPGDAIVVSLIDMGGRLRLVCQDIHCVKPILPMPNLPVARVMWQAEPSLTTGVECWITAGGTHHTVLSYDVTAELRKDWANMMDIEFVRITKGHHGGGPGARPVPLRPGLEAEITPLFGTREQGKNLMPGTVFAQRILRRRPRRIRGNHDVGKTKKAGL